MLMLQAEAAAEDDSGHDLGPHAFFIVTAYGAAALIVAVMIAWVSIDYRGRAARSRTWKRAASPAAPSAGARP